MLDRPPGERESLSWLCVVVWTGLIFVTIPFAPRIAGIVTRSFGGSVITIALVVLASAALAAVLFALVKRGRTSTVGYLWFAATASFLILLLTVLKSPHPAESLHYLEYAVLGVLLYRALAHRIRDYSIYAVAVILGTGIGTLDELIQWLTPGRYFELADIGLNFTGVALAQVMLAAAIRPTIISGWPDSDGLRRLGYCAAVLPVLLGLCIGIVA